MRASSTEFPAWRRSPTDWIEVPPGIGRELRRGRGRPSTSRCQGRCGHAGRKKPRTRPSRPPLLWGRGPAGGVGSRSLPLCGPVRSAPALVGDTLVKAFRPRVNLPTVPVPMAPDPRASGLSVGARVAMGTAIARAISRPTLVIDGGPEVGRHRLWQKSMLIWGNRCLNGVVLRSVLFVLSKKVSG